MRTYRLEPIPGREDDRAWESSEIPPQVCWVLARNEDDARVKVHLATYKMIEAKFGRKKVRPPWQDGSISKCVPDDSRAAPEDAIILADGEIFEIPRS